jgi:hypothetical protein
METQSVQPVKLDGNNFFVLNNNTVYCSIESTTFIKFIYKLN